MDAPEAPTRPARRLGHLSRGTARGPAETNLVRPGTQSGSEVSAGRESPVIGCPDEDERDGRRCENEIKYFHVNTQKRNRLELSVLYDEISRTQPASLGARSRGDQGRSRARSPCHAFFFGKSNIRAGRVVNKILATGTPRRLRSRTRSGPTPRSRHAPVGRPECLPQAYEIPPISLGVTVVQKELIVTVRRENGATVLDRAPVVLPYKHSPLVRSQHPWRNYSPSSWPAP